MDCAGSHCTSISVAVTPATLSANVSSSVQVSSNPVRRSSQDFTNGASAVRRLSPDGWSPVGSMRCSGVFVICAPKRRYVNMGSVNCVGSAVANCPTDCTPDRYHRLPGSAWSWLRPSLSGEVAPVSLANAHSSSSPAPASAVSTSGMVRA
jgi:hypothetical protein